MRITRQLRHLPVACILCLSPLLIANVAIAEDAKPRQKKATLNAPVNVELDYLLYLPKDYDSQESWPLVQGLAEGRGVGGFDGVAEVLE